MYSLTEATKLLVKHYEIGSKDAKNEIVKKYNTHKLRHSNGVLEIGRNLLIKIKENRNISKELMNRAEIVLFLHDIARFYQNNKERILTGGEFEHGNEAYKILKEENYDEKICLAVKYHNKFDINGLSIEKTFLELNEDDKNETIFLTKFIRDADKLQNMIYQLFDIEGLIVLDPKLKKGDISDKIINSVKNKCLVDKKNINNIADGVVSIIGWIFDINFIESINMLNYYNFSETIFKELSKLEFISKSKIEIIRQNVNDFINNYK